MGIRLNVHCDGPTCTQSEPFPDQRNSILPPSAPKDWLVINVKTWRQVHKTALAELHTGDADNTRYFCSPRCLTIFSLVWWLGPEYAAKEHILLDIRRLNSDKPL